MGEVQRGAVERLAGSGEQDRLQARPAVLGAGPGQELPCGGQLAQRAAGPRRALPDEAA